MDLKGVWPTVALVGVVSKSQRCRGGKKWWEGNI